MELVEIRKEDDKYFQGGFWVIADTYSDILKNNFTLESIKILSDYNGNYCEPVLSKRSLVHRQYWKNNFENKYNKSFDYYPRGRVGIYNGIAYINISNKLNYPQVINKIIKEYNLAKLEIDVEIQEDTNSDYYGFELK